ncbi:MAG: Eco57I restriction-modification methylase domain-containing protein [Sphaerochaetaceae bacterium]|nr:Eco57I restriction-modification methylase domain-containing protein [Sphaerochaetaceae bacterium]
MNKKDIPIVLSNTFDQPFNLENYIQFIRELLKDKVIIENKQFNVSKEFSDQIKNFIKVGEYKTGRNNIEILVAETNSLDRARTAQRNFVAKWLNNSMFPKDAALVAFYDPKREDWRFSFVKMEYKFDEKGKPTQDITPAKRYSFLVGKNEPNHTCKRIFLDLITDNEKQLTLEDIENSFSVDNVTKEFFEEYKNRFFELKAELDRIINQNKIVATEFEAKGINSIEFAKKLLGQIVFLYFLQKKGWLGIKKSDTGFDEWGAGPKDFMKKLFNKELVNYDNFFNDILEPLFYQALANDRRADNDYYEKLKCKIPFLNGGLFEPIKAYSWETTDIIIDNTVFKDIFATFDRFNFTIKEDEPLEKEVAVDPEMLGKVFENLLDVTDRKSKGAFYTPREIVHYMCQQSLINYLETNTKDLKIKREEIELFIQQGDFALNQVKRIVELTKSNKLYLLKEGDDKLILPASIRNNYKEIDNLLSSIKICDPAVGSGAFPVGMMNEIIKARNILTYFFNEKEQKERTDYYLKRQTIENSLYGVDIEPSAVEITKLRFWLSLIVDETDMKNINPLPNLDNKIMCGNSLLEEYKGIKLFDKSLVLKGTSSGRQMTLVKKESDYKFELLQQLQNELFNEQDRNKKKILMKKIEDIEWEFIKESLKEQKKENEIKELEKFKSSKAKPFFLWELYFSDVFRRENPGFDVVIGNPPYVRVQKVDTDLKQGYIKKYFSANGKFDLYLLFVEQGINLLNESGNISYIMPNKFTNASYGKNLRNLILEKTDVKIYIDFGDKGVFESATTYPCVVLFSKCRAEKKVIHYAHIKRMSPTMQYSLNKVTGGNNFENEDLLSFTFEQNKLDSHSWSFSNESRSRLLEKFKGKKYSTLKYYRQDVYEGLITGNNKVFFINSDKINKYKLEEGVIRALPKGKKIMKYFLGLHDYYVIFPYTLLNNKTTPLQLEKYPHVKKYFEEYKVELEKRSYLMQSGKKWWEIWNPRDIKLFSTTKIITPNLTKENRFALDLKSNSKEFICIDHDCYGIILKDKNIENYVLFLAILNSPLTRFFIEQISPMFSGGFYKYHTQYLDLLPIPINYNVHPVSKSIVEKTKEILKITADKDYSESQSKQTKVNLHIKQVDKLVYALYELSQEEIEIIEKCGIENE